MQSPHISASAGKYQVTEVAGNHESDNTHEVVLDLMASLDSEIAESMSGQDIQVATPADVHTRIPEALDKIQAAITWKSDSYQLFNWRQTRLKALDSAVEAYTLTETSGNEAAELDALKGIKEKIAEFAVHHPKSRQKAIHKLTTETDARLDLLKSRAAAKARLSSGEQVRAETGAPTEALEKQSALLGTDVQNLKSLGFHVIDESRLQKIESGLVKGAAARAIKEISRNLSLIESVTLDDPGRLDGIAKSMAQACERIENGMAKRVASGRKVAHSKRLSGIVSQTRQQAEFFQSRIKELKKPIVESRIRNGLLGVRRDKKQYIGAPHTALTGVKGSSFELLNTVSEREAVTLGVGHFTKEITEKGAKLIVGEGGGGKVRLARDLNTGELLAVKKIKLDSETSLNSASLEEVYSEIKLQDAASETPGVVPITDYLLTKDAKGGDTVYVFLPLIKIDTHYFETLQQLDAATRQSEIRDKSLEALRMFSDLHAHNIFHRDIKLDNMIVDQKGHLHLIDFGLASRKDQVKGFDGTAAYLAPEVHDKAKRSDTHSAAKADAWALGITLYEMAVGKRPMGLSDIENSWECQGIVRTSEPDLSVITDEKLRGVISGLLIKDPQHRLTVQEAYDDLSVA
ncbi:MAG: protein kinase [bacterium]|nr:protein kinase [bacterium]